MNAHPFCFLPTALVLASATAQAPEQAPSARPEVALQSLQALVSDTIYQLQPLSPTPDGPGAQASGTAVYQPFARIRDARFERDGRLAELVLESPAVPAGVQSVRRVLPAKGAVWEEAGKRWLTVEPNLKFEALAEVTKPAPDADPILVKQDRSLLASELVLATVTGVAPTKPPEAVEAKAAKVEKPTAVLWLVPSAQALAFAVVPLGQKHVPLPWPMLRLMDHGETVQILLEPAPAVLDEAPQSKNALEPPSAALRQRCYQHYGVPVPKWDRAASDGKDGQAPLGKRNGKSDDR